MSVSDMSNRSGMPDEPEMVPPVVAVELMRQAKDTEALSGRVESLARTVDDNETERVKAHESLEKKVDAGFQRLSDRLWQAALIIGGPILVAVIVQVVAR